MSNFKVGDRVWASFDRRHPKVIKGELPGVIVGVGIAVDWEIEVECEPSHHISGHWQARSERLRPRDDGRDTTTWSNCHWRPAGVPENA